MTRRPAQYAGLSAGEAADWQECQSDHDDLMAQLTDREAQIETGLIDTYEDYVFIWERQGGPSPGAQGPPSGALPRERRETAAGDPPF